MGHRLLLSFVTAAALLSAGEPPARQHNTSTQRLDMAANGILRVDGSFGELSVEGWDRPDVEVTILRTAPTEAELNLVQITAQRSKEDAVITTTIPKVRFPKRLVKNTLPVDLEYRIKAPRGARIVIGHLYGEVHLTNLTGELHVTDKHGQITVYLAADAGYAIDAFTKLGAVDSDFPGEERPRTMKLGHTFLREAPADKPKLYLRVGYGDITILRESKPTISLKAVAQ
jgi:hypothetical protein